MTRRRSDGRGEPRRLHDLLEYGGWEAGAPAGSERFANAAGSGYNAWTARNLCINQEEQPMKGIRLLLLFFPVAVAAELLHWG
ncbi:MAG: hypothetical protein KDD91_08155, partial [Caldilinea sp.]|nr:hypothetical protein [Caldilinea sp.]